MKSIIFLPVVLLLMGCGAVRHREVMYVNQGDIAINEVGSVGDLVALSSDVVRARVLNEQEVSGSEISLSTVSEVTVLEVFYGDLSVGETVSIVQRGGETDYLVVRNMYLVNLAESMEVVLFLERDSLGRLTLVNPYLAYEVVGEELVSLAPWGDLEFGLEDLR